MSVDSPLRWAEAITPCRSPQQPRQIVTMTSMTQSSDFAQALGLRRLRSLLLPQRAAIKNHTEPLHVGGNHDRRATILGERHEGLVHLVLQVLGRERRVDDAIRLRQTLSPLDRDLGILD